MRDRHFPIGERDGRDDRRGDEQDPGTAVTQDRFGDPHSCSMLNDTARGHKRQGPRVATWKAMRRAFLLLLWLSRSVCAQQVHPVTGRHIASVMGIGGADWLVRPERAAGEAPEAALDAIGIARGSVVADIGAGAGYFTWRLAERVGPTGKVYANDIQPEMLEL